MQIFRRTSAWCHEALQTSLDASAKLGRLRGSTHITPPEAKRFTNPYATAVSWSIVTNRIKIQTPLHKRNINFRHFRRDARFQLVLVEGTYTPSATSNFQTAHRCTFYKPLAHPDKSTGCKSNTSATAMASFTVTRDLTQDFQRNPRAFAFQVLHPVSSHKFAPLPIGTNQKS